MIVVDTSALMALLLDEADAAAVADCLASEPEVAISAATLAEALIVAGRRGIRPAMQRLVDDLLFEVVPVTGATAVAVADAYQRFGKGGHPAALNYGDCFAYVTAQGRGCPLAFVGDDFARTDVIPAI